TRWGGFTGWATRQRWRPFSVSVNRLGTIVDVDDARMASGAASRSSSANIVRLASSVSGEFSWMKLAPSNESDRLVAARTRAAATLASFTKPCADSSSSASDTRPCAWSATPEAASLERHIETAAREDDG